MRKILAAVAMMFVMSGFGQSPPVAVNMTHIDGITADSNTVIDNRSQALRQNNSHLFCATGTGSWGIQSQYRDGVDGVWTNFTDYTSAVTSTSVGCAGGANGYHDYIRFVFSGANASTARIAYSGVKNLYLLTQPAAGTINYPNQVINRPFITITDAPFGAVAGTSSPSLCTANTTAINAAITQASSQGTARVVVPSGVYPVHTINLFNQDSTLSGLTFEGPGTLQSCAAEPLLVDGYSPPTTVTHYGLRLQNLNLDCNGIGTIGLYIGPFAADNATRGLQVRNCTKGIVLDGTQNSAFYDIGLYGNTLPLEEANGTGEIIWNRTEVQMAATSMYGIFLGNDSTLPNYVNSPSSGSNTTTFNMVQVECNGPSSCTTAPGPIAVSINGGFNVIRDSLINSGPIGGPELILVNGTNNVFENNFYNTSGFDEKTFVMTGNFNVSNNNPNRIIGGTIFFGGACAQPFLTTSALTVLDKVGYGPSAYSCFTMVDTSGLGIAATVQYTPAFNSGPSNQLLPPVGTVGSFFYNPNTGPGWWNNTAFVDANGNTPGRARTLSGNGSPNGAVSGLPGDVYRNLTATNKIPATWTKTTSGTTGWIGDYNGYQIQNQGANGTYIFTTTPLTLTSITLDVPGVWDITAITNGTVCQGGDICHVAVVCSGCSIYAGGTGVLSPNQYTLIGLPYTFTVTSVPFVVTLQISTLSTPSGTSSAVNGMLIANLRNAL